MKLEYHNHKLKSIFGWTDDIKQDKDRFAIRDQVIFILWNRNTTPVQLSVDDLTLTLAPNQLVTTTYLQHVSYKHTDLPLTAFTFNREFYCIADHDSEVSCNGILFFGTQDIPVITIPEDQQRKFDLLLEVLCDEFRTPDTIQGDMLQMLLKRLIIMCTRLAKEQHIVHTLDNDQIDTIRKFNYLVDVHYKTKRRVSDYADLLFKSPKTLSNLFAIYDQKTPQQVIHERIALEAKRMMMFTDKQTQEIAFDLGFSDPAHFSKFFKKTTQLTPSQYKEAMPISG